MPETKRKIKRYKRKKALIFFLIFSLLVIAAAGSIFAYIKLSQRQLFISPIPPNYEINSGSENDKKIKLLEKKLKEKKIEFSSISDNGKYFTVRLKNKSEIIFAANKDINIQIASLQFILTRLTMEGKLFTQLDLRYDKPVIR